MELSWRKAMEEKERVEKNMIMEERERERERDIDFFFWGLEISIECIK